MKRKLLLMLMFLSIFTAGCDWEDIGDFLNGDNDKTWWDENDEHIRWAFWPFDDLFD